MTDQRKTQGHLQERTTSQPRDTPAAIRSATPESSPLVEPPAEPRDQDIAALPLRDLLRMCAASGSMWGRCKAADATIWRARIEREFGARWTRWPLEKFAARYMPPPRDWFDVWCGLAEDFASAPLYVSAYIGSNKNAPVLLHVAPSYEAARAFLSGQLGRPIDEYEYDAKIEAYFVPFVEVGRLLGNAIGAGGLFPPPNSKAQIVIMPFDGDLRAVMAELRGWLV